jgi:hypothetical protein
VGDNKLLAIVTIKVHPMCHGLRCAQGRQRCSSDVVRDVQVNGMLQSDTVHRSLHRIMGKITEAPQSTLFSTVFKLKTGERLKSLRRHSYQLVEPARECLAIHVFSRNTIIVE